MQNTVKTKLVTVQRTLWLAVVLMCQTGGCFRKVDQCIDFLFEVVFIQK